MFTEWSSTRVHRESRRGQDGFNVETESRLRNMPSGLKICKFRAKKGLEHIHIGHSRYRKAPGKKPGN